VSDEDRKQPPYHFDRHAPEYRHQFEASPTRCTAAADRLERHLRRPLGGHAAVRCTSWPGPRSTCPTTTTSTASGAATGGSPSHAGAAADGARGFWRWTRRAALLPAGAEPVLSPAAVSRWVPFIDELVRASLDERIESAASTSWTTWPTWCRPYSPGHAGHPLQKWSVYCEPMHATIYTPPGSPELEHVAELYARWPGPGHEYFRSSRTRGRGSSTR